ncbi:MAG: blue (type 1) copper domain protein [Candidatus Saccharibacteria bacterium]|nr:blue (type 1) copper domain protein [Candidatus Saccharibacteria bacterium]
MTTSKMLGFLIILVILVGAVVAYSKKPKSITTTTTPTSSTQTQTPASSTSPAGGNIKMTNMMFTPSQISVAKGATVTWTNDDTVTHTVVDDLSNVGGPASGDIAPGATYSFTFEKAGSFQYHCSIHSSMRGTIVVK